MQLTVYSWLTLLLVSVSGVTALLSDYGKVVYTEGGQCSGQIVQTVNGLNVSNCRDIIEFHVTDFIPKTDYENLNARMELADVKNPSKTFRSPTNTFSNKGSVGEFDLYNYFGEICQNVTYVDPDGLRGQYEECFPAITPVQLSNLETQLAGASPGDVFRFLISGTKNDPNENLKWSFYFGDIYIDPLWSAPDGQILINYGDLSGTDFSSVTVNPTSGAVSAEATYGTAVAISGGRICPIINANRSIVYMSAAVNASFLHFNMSSSPSIVTYTNQNANIRLLAGTCFNMYLDNEVVLDYINATNSETVTPYTSNDGLTFTWKNSSINSGAGISQTRLNGVGRKGVNEGIVVGCFATPENSSFVKWYNYTSHNFDQYRNLTALQQGCEGAGGINTPRRTIPLVSGYETISGRSPIFFANTTDTAGRIYVLVRNATENGGNLLGTIQAHTLTNQFAKVEYVDMECDPYSDNCIVIISTASNSSVYIWNGTNLTNPFQLSTATVDTTNAQALYEIADAVFKIQTDNSSIVRADLWYAVANSAIPRSATYNGSTWAVGRNGTLRTATGSADIWDIQVVTNPNGAVGINNNYGYVVTCDQDGDGSVEAFNETHVSNYTEFDADIQGSCNGRFPLAVAWNVMDVATPAYQNFTVNDTSVAQGSSEIIQLNITVVDNVALNNTIYSDNSSGAWINYSTDAGRFCTHVQSTYYQPCLLNISNSSWNPGTYGAKVYVLDTRGTNPLELNYTFTVISSGGLCTGTSDCTITCPQTVSSAVDVGGYNLLFSGTGLVNVNAAITNFNIMTIDTSSCTVQVNKASGGSITR